MTAGNTLVAVTKHMDIAGLLRLDIITQDPDENLSFHSRHVLATPMLTFGSFSHLICL